MIRMIQRAVRSWTLCALVCFAVVFIQSPTADASCCKGTSCTDDNLILCALSGGNWLPGPCIPLITCAISGGLSACCQPLLGCIDSPESLCFGQFMGGMECSEISSCRNLPPPGACCGLINQCSNTIEDGCTGFGETFIEGETCDSARCGLLGASGACCSVLGCADLPSSVACLGGSFRAGRTCEEINQCQPPEVFGACCQGGTCAETSESTCDVNGGIFAANASCTADLCTIPEPEGACCASEGRCVESREGDCLTGEFYQGETCDDATLCEVIQPPETGACCVQGQCLAATHAECNARGGDYHGDGSDCSTVRCAPPLREGACCTSGGCTQTTEDVCTDGSWHDGESCASAGICGPAEVACCDASLSCSLLAEEVCEQSGGTVVGAQCSAGICGTPPGACCVDEQATQDDAESCQGTFIPDVTPETVDCTGRGIVGGCCLGNGKCEPSTRSRCEFEGGSWGSATCDEESACHEPQPNGACCEASGCRVVRQDACDGAFHEGAQCTAGLCDLPDEVGACCTGSTCSISTEDECLDELGGVFSPDADCGDLELICPGAVRGACCAQEECTEQAKDTCERYGGAFHAGGSCNEANLCGDEGDEDEPPIEPPAHKDTEVALTGGRLFSCASQQTPSSAPWLWLVGVGAAIGIARRRVRREFPNF